MAKAGSGITVAVGSFTSGVGCWVPVREASMRDSSLSRLRGGRHVDVDRYVPKLPRTSCRAEI